MTADRLIASIAVHPRALRLPDDNSSQHPAQPLSAPNAPSANDVRLFRRDQPVAKPLAVPLKMIMRDKFMNRLAQRAFPEQDHSLQTGFLNRPYEAFRMGVQIRRTRRQLHALDSGGTKRAQKLRGVQRIAVMDQVLLPHQETLHVVAEIASYLCHP